MANKNLFNSIQLPFQKSNVFDLTHDVKMSTVMGRLTPCLCMEAVPGDKFNISAESLIRFAPLVSPVMHRMDVTIHYFFVPNRILWKNWETFITGGQLDNPINVVPPYLPLRPTDTVKSLANYLGLPVPTSTHNVSALPFAAYQKVWDDYYRDQNLQGTLFGFGGIELVDGDNSDNEAQFKMFRTRAWEHDYFTSALPFAQKGEAVSIPLGDVRLKDDWPTHSTGDPAFILPDGTAANTGDITQAPGSPDQSIMGSSNPGDPLAYDPRGSLEVQSTTINDLRRSFRLQEWLERNARAGTRYVESLLAHFGVRSSDKRMQRPEYITGTKSPVIISEVLNTAGEGLPQGNMAGHGVSVTSGKQGSYYAEEHGYVIGIMSVLPKTAYQQGIPRHFTKFDRLEYYWPSFAHIGEQEIKNKELYVDAVNPDDTFGYVPRYAEYKYMPSRVAGDFQGNLSFWHLGRIFEAEPTLSPEFVMCDPSRRIFAVEDPTEDYLYCHVLNKIRAVRKMPKFGTPMF